MWLIFCIARGRATGFLISASADQWEQDFDDVMWTTTFSQETSKGHKLASIIIISNLSGINLKCVAFFYIGTFTKVVESKLFIRGH